MFTRAYLACDLPCISKAQNPPSGHNKFGGLLGFLIFAISPGLKAGNSLMIFTYLRC